MAPCPNSESRTEAEQEALIANEGFYRALGASDAGAMENVWARVAPVTCLHPGWTLLSGREAVLESWRTILANPNQPRIVGGGASVTVFGDAALVLCREVVSGSALYATNVFVREGRDVAHDAPPLGTGDGSWWSVVVATESVP